MTNRLEILKIKTQVDSSLLIEKFTKRDQVGTEREIGARREKRKSNEKKDKKQEGRKEGREGGTAGEREKEEVKKE